MLPYDDSFGLMDLEPYSSLTFGRPVREGGAVVPLRRLVRRVVAPNYLIDLISYWYARDTPVGRES